MRTFKEWAQHYGQQDTPEARQDYSRYVAELRMLGGMTTAMRELERAADHVAEMQEILKNGDGMQSMLAAYGDATDALCRALQYSLEIDKPR